MDGENYLIPLKARIERQQDVCYQALPVGHVLGAMEDAGNDLNVLILDACRNTPFTRSWRSSEAGLAAPPTARGTLIAYATAPGGVAVDGDGENGVYTKHLLQTMTLPGLSIEHVFKKVRSEVVAETNGKQVPWESSSLLGDFTFVPAPSGTTPLATVSSSAPPQPSAAPATPGVAAVSPAAPSTSTPFRRSPDRTAFPPVPEDRPGEAVGPRDAPEQSVPGLSFGSYTLIRRIYCENVGSGEITSSIDLIATSRQSCEEARKVLLGMEQEKDNCRYPRSTNKYVDDNARESRQKAKEWIGTHSCKL